MHPDSGESLATANRTNKCPSGSTHTALHIMLRPDGSWDCRKHYFYMHHFSHWSSNSKG